MILPMMGFFLMLIVVGAVGILVVEVDKKVRRFAPVVYIMFFVGLSVWVFVLLGGSLGSLISTQFGDVLGFLAGPVVGVVCGSLLGYYLGSKRQRRGLR